MYGKRWFVTGDELTIDLLVACIASSRLGKPCRESAVEWVCWGSEG